MQITIDLMQLLTGLLMIVGIAIAIVLFVMVLRLNSTFKRITRLVGEIQEPLAGTMRQLPEMMKRLGTVAEEVSMLTASVNQSVPAILKDAQAVSGTVRSGVEAIGGAATDIGDGVSSFFHPVVESRTGTLETIVDIASQVMAVVSLFTADRKKSVRHGRTRRRRK